MVLSSAQLTTIKNDIANTPALAAFPNNSDGNFAIAALYNATASPAFVVWRTNVMVKELNAVFVWVDVDNLSVGKARIWDWMSKQSVIDASNTNVRDGLSQCFGANSATFLAALPVFKRNATRLEKLLATGTGSTAAPANLGAEGNINYSEIEQARNSG